MTASTSYEFESLFERSRQHLLAASCALLFVWIWPYLAIRDALVTGDARWITATVQIGGWLTLGACIIVGRGRRSRPSGFMAALFLVFLSIWYVQFFLLGAPAAADADNYAYAALSCLAPFVAGWYFPRALLGLFCGWLAGISVALGVVVTLLNLTILPVGNAVRNQIFPSFNPISQAAVLAIGVLAMMYYRPPRALSIGRLFLLLIAGVQILLTASRGPIIGLALALLVSEAMPAKTQRKRLWTVLVLGFLLIGVFLFKDYLPENVLTRVFDVDQSVNMRGDAGGASARVGPIMEAIRLGTTRPLLGWGESANPIVGYYCHNFFAQAFLETGLIGLAAALLLLVSGGVRLARWARQLTGDGRFVFAIFVLFVTVYQFAGTPVYALQLWFLLGVAATDPGAPARRSRLVRATGPPVPRAPYAAPVPPVSVPVSAQHPTVQGV